MVIRVTIHVAIAISVAPLEGDLAHAVHALIRVYVEVALVARTSTLAAIHTDAAFRRICARWALFAEEIALYFIDKEVVVLGTELAAAGAGPAVAQVARVALSQVIRVTTAH